MNIHDVVAAVPKAELHNHLIGSASPWTVARLARRHPELGVPSSAEALRSLFEFRDFAHFISVYDRVDTLVTDPDDITDLVVGAAADAAACTVRWLELTVTAATHLEAGLSGRELREALQRGRSLARADHGVELGFIVDIAAEKGVERADRTLEFLASDAPDGTVAVGLSGMEAGYPRALYADHMAAARDLGLPAVVHAGESTGPETIWSALEDLQAIRIGHGTQAYRDPVLVAHLAAQGVPLEVCLTSNVRTGSVPSLEEHPVVGYLEHGVVVTLSTDDAGMFGTDLNREYALLAHLAGLTAADLMRIARNGVDASLAPQVTKDAILCGMTAAGDRLGAPE